MPIGERPPRFEHAHVGKRRNIIFNALNTANICLPTISSGVIYPQNRYSNPSEASYIVTSSTATTNSASGPEDYRTSANTTDLEHGSEAHLNSVREVIYSAMNSNEVK